MKRYHLLVLALVSGLLLSAAWPVRGFTPLIFIAFVPLFFIQDELGKPQNKGKGGQFSCLDYSVSLFGIYSQLTGYGILRLLAEWLLLSSIVFLWQLFFWLYHFTKVHLYQNRKGSLIFLFYWLSFEFLHLNWDLNWPWLNLGNVFSPHHHWIQWYEFTGAAGGTIWVILMNILAYKTIQAVINFKQKKRVFSLNLLLFATLWMAPVLLGEHLYRNYEENGVQADIIVVQPNFDPYSEQYELPPASDIIDRNLQLAASAMAREADFIIGPPSRPFRRTFGCLTATKPTA